LKESFRGVFPKIIVSQLWLQVPLKSIGNDRTCDHSWLWGMHPRSFLWIIVSNWKPL